MSKNFMVTSLNYAGRRFQRHRPSAILAQSNPDLKWCTVCNQTVPKAAWGAHVGGVQHRLNTRKNDKLQDFALGLWEEHRGAPLHEESNVERSIRDGSVAEAFARQEARSDDFAGRMLAAERSRAQLLGVAADANDGDDDERGYAYSHKRLASGGGGQGLEGDGVEDCGSGGVPRGDTYVDYGAYYDARERGEDLSPRQHRRQQEQRAVVSSSAHTVAHSSTQDFSSAASSPLSSSNAHKKQQELINHAALRREMMLSGVEEEGAAAGERGHRSTGSSNSRHSGVGRAGTQSRYDQSSLGARQDSTGGGSRRDDRAHRSGEYASPSLRGGREGSSGEGRGRSASSGYGRRR